MFLVVVHVEDLKVGLFGGVFIPLFELFLLTNLLL